MFCARQFNCKFFDVRGIKTNIQRAVKAYVDNSVNGHQIRTARFVYELIMLRENVLVLSNNVDLSSDELNQLINVACTN